MRDASQFGEEVFGVAVADEWTKQIDNYAGTYDPLLYRPRDAATAVPRSLDGLTSADLDAFRSDGYLAVANALPAASVRSAIDGLDALISGAVPGFRGIQWEGAVRDRLPRMDLDERRRSVRKLIYYVEHEARLYRIAHDPAVLDLARTILGAEPALFADQALLKPPGIGREKPWHQDKAYFDLRPGAPVVGFWLALDDTDPENGCMHVIPGSHRAGPAVHFNRRDFQICDTDVRRGEVTAVPLRAGGCLVFDGLMHHGTPMNRSSRRRWALQFHYAPADAVWQSREQRAIYKAKRLAVFGADGKDVTC